MATAAVIGLSAGKRLLSSSFYSSEFTDKLFSVHDLGVATFSATSTKNVITAKKSTNFGPGFPSNRNSQSLRALKEHVDTSAPSMAETRDWRSDLLEKDGNNFESSLEILILLQKSMLEKQWNLSFNQNGILDAAGGGRKKVEVTRSGISARQRRTNLMRRGVKQNACTIPSGKMKHLGSPVSPELLKGHLKGGYVKGVISKDLLSHAEVTHLSKKIKAGLSLEKHRLR